MPNQLISLFMRVFISIYTCINTPPLNLPSTCIRGVTSKVDIARQCTIVFFPVIISTSVTSLYLPNVRTFLHSHLSVRPGISLTLGLNRSSIRADRITEPTPSTDTMTL